MLAHPCNAEQLCSKNLEASVTRPHSPGHFVSARHSLLEQHEAAHGQHPAAGQMRSEVSTAHRMNLEITKDELVLRTSICSRDFKVSSTSSAAASAS